MLSLLVAITAVAGSVGLVTAAPVQAASVTSAAFGGGAGTFTAANGTVYAKQGAALTLTLATDGNTQCVDVINANGNTIATQSASKGQAAWTFSGSAYPWLTAGTGSGVVSYTTKAWRNVNGQGRCVANQNETFGIQSAAYTLDNVAPTATGAPSPAPNAAGWNKSDVTVTWTGSDVGGSGVKSVSPATDTVTADGTVTRTATVTDNVGNTGTGSVTVTLDKTAPTITGSRTPAANANGWNNSNVTVSFAPSDATSGVKTSSGPTTLTADGANQSVTGTVVDNADNTASATVSGINIDKVAPALTGAPTTSANANGWYKGDVTVAWTATDALSGVTSPANTTIGGEGTDLSSSTSATDKAGNVTSATSRSVKIDRTAPVTTVTAPPAWNKSDVTLTLVPNDALSGVDKTFYQLDGGATTEGVSIPVTAQGTHTLKFWSTDKAGNVEVAGPPVSFGIDKTSPAIGHTQNPAPNENGWNNTSVTVTFACSDALSGVVACTGPQTVGTEGRNQAVTGTARDAAGNSATDPATVSIDKTAPTISVALDRAANGYGWYGDDVTATYTCGDTLSGTGTCPAADTFGEGAAQKRTGTVSDAAGNSTSVTTPAVSVDKTAPTVTGTVVTTPNGNGWFAGDVTVHWTCADNLSGVVSCPADTVVTGEGGNLSASVSVADKAGHTASGTVGGITIDRTTPATTATGVPAGWVKAPVTVGLRAGDNLSGVDTTFYTVDGAATPTAGDTVTVGSEGVHSVSYWSKDRAGNVESAKSFTVRVDLSSPTITTTQSPARNDKGWNNTDVTVSFGCADQTTLSGLAGCPEPQSVTTDGKGQKVTGQASDNAGNTASATATVNVDKTAPTISGSADRAPNAAGWYRDDVTVSFTADDPLSGVDTVTGPQHVGAGKAQSVDGTATDNAGNSASTTVSGLNVDKTPPTLSAAPTTAANDNGWYNSDVTLDWACADDLSGVAGDCPADSVLSSEGDHQIDSASVSDVAGNTTASTSEPVRIDKTRPTTDVSAPGGWVNGAATVTLTGHDGLSGVEATYAAVDGGSAQATSSVQLTTEGTHNVAYYSVDRAGNVEATRSVTVQIDKTAPTITHTQTPARNGNGWNNADVTVTFQCDDQTALSGIAFCTTPVTVTAQGRDIAVPGTATDNAGNSATDPATVSIDKVAPTISGSRTPAGNEYGWNNTDVTVHFDAADALSGVDTVTADRTLGEGTSQSVTGTVADAAGNTASTTVDGINVDKTAPTLSGAPTTPANGNGWYRGDVVIRWTAGDDRSGVVAAPADSTIAGEGAGLQETATVSDKAGNPTTADSSAVSIDRTAPTTSADAPAGWNNSSVAVSLSAKDGLSGVDATYYQVDGGTVQSGASLTVDTEGEHTVDYWSVDQAGNVEAAHGVTVRIDLTKPTITHTVTPTPNAHGWNRTPVTVAYRCADALSGVADCSPEVTVGTNGAGQAVPGTAVDKAGNSQLDNAAVSIDTVPPTVSGAPDRAANGNGWYADDVTVGFTCDDTLSGVAECTAPTRLGEGRGQSATGTATDDAGNSATTTVSGIDVDKTPPSLSGAPTAAPNAAGWYNGDVTIHWTAADALSGIDGSDPADSIIDGAGRELTAVTSVRDRAGNETQSRTAPVKIDRIAPKTEVTAPEGWTNNTVTVDFSATDNLSGVAATYYQLDSAPAAAGTSVVVATEGVHTLQVWSVDNAGNVEAQQNLKVQIDKAAPTITHTQSPAANGKGWNNTDVTVTFACADQPGMSGVKSCTQPQTTITEGKQQKVEGKAYDNAGNVATDEASVSIDKSKPTVSGALSRDANGNGWYDADVTVTFTCADQEGLSGLISCSPAKTFGEGADQSVTGSATDGADNSATSTVSGVNVDKTAPTLSGAATTGPNGNGWYRGDVTVHWTAGDALSGLQGAAPADSTVAGEGNALSAAATVQDKAGNATSRSVGVKIDRTEPVTGTTAPLGWQGKDVTLQLTATDNLSGVDATRYTIDAGAEQSGTSVTVATEGAHKVAFWSVDKAGNVESKKTVTVLVDKSAPTIVGKAIVAPNGNGWYHAPVTVHFDCADAVSGVDSCQPDVTVAAEGSTTVPGTAVDKAGNKTSTTVGPILVDTVAPVVTVGGVVDGATYVLGNVPTPTASATDATSGLAAAATGSRTGGMPNGVGTFTYTATATDKAGNVGTKTVGYTVRYGYGATLFLQPVNDTAHQTGTSTSVFKAGQTIPMKFQLTTASGQVVQSATAPNWLTPVKGNSTSAAVNEAAYAASADSGLDYRWDGTQYLYNWNTDKTQAGYYWRVGVSLDDGQTYFVNIGLR